MGADGGPAFPVENIIAEGKIVCHRGMSLRDYFAAKAMQALIASDRMSMCVPTAYQVADDMLRARAKAGS